MLEGKNVNLKIVEKEDLPLLNEWWNNPEVGGRYNPLIAQESKIDIEKMYEKRGSDRIWFLITKKDGRGIGYMGMGLVGPYWEIGYELIPNERGKGYCTEAVQIAVDYLFLSKDIVRVQATTQIKNVASRKILEKTGFQREGIIRKGMFAWGNWHDLCLYSILREEWKEARILTKTTSEM